MSTPMFILVLITSICVILFLVGLFHGNGGMAGFALIGIIYCAFFGFGVWANFSKKYELRRELFTQAYKRPEAIILVETNLIKSILIITDVSTYNKIEDKEMVKVSQYGWVDQYNSTNWTESYTLIK